MSTYSNTWKERDPLQTGRSRVLDKGSTIVATCYGNCHTHEYTHTNCDANSAPYRESDAYDSAISNAA